MATAAQILEQLAEEIRACRKCQLSDERQNAVPGEGSAQSRVMFVGEAPGQDEDVQGRPFVGRAGQLLRKLIAHIGLAEGDYYIGNVLKCRPPGNRDPEPVEVNACQPYLFAQLAVIKPLVIVPLGNFALQLLVNPKFSISKVRGQLLSRDGLNFFATYHPAAILRGSANLKRDLIADFEKIPQLLLELSP